MIKIADDKRKTVRVRPNADPEELQKDLTAGPVVIQEPRLSQRPDIVDPAVQPYLSAERGSGCWITAAITPQTVSSAGCDQSCCSAGQGLVAVLSNHSRGCKLKRRFFLPISQGFTAPTSLKYRF